MKKLLSEFDLPFRDIAAILSIGLFLAAVWKWSAVAAALIIVARVGQ